MKLRCLVSLLIMIGLAGCSIPDFSRGGGGFLADDPVPIISQTASSTPFQPIPKTPTPTSTDTPTMTSTFTPTATPTVTVTFTPQPTCTPRPTIAATATSEWPWNPPGQASVPILLYHHIADIYNPYYLSPDAFREELAYLADNGYETISIALLAQAISQGANLPNRPVIFTFDDGNVDVYQNAFPILREYGFTATIYIVGSYLGSSGHMSAGQIGELTSAGWEVGSHSMNHYDLTGAPGLYWSEVTNSRVFLEDSLGVPVQSFAYPYGGIDYGVTNYASQAGYQAAVGLGTSWQHSTVSLFDLDRIEIRYGTDLSTFISRLPW